LHHEHEAALIAMYGAIAWVITLTAAWIVSGLRKT
jgi:hypothetical protein